MTIAEKLEVLTAGEVTNLQIINYSVIRSGGRQASKSCGGFLP